MNMTNATVKPPPPSLPLRHGNGRSVQGPPVAAKRSHVQPRENRSTGRPSLAPTLKASAVPLGAGTTTHRLDRPPSVLCRPGTSWLPVPGRLSCSSDRQAALRVRNPCSAVRLKVG